MISPRHFSFDLVFDFSVFLVSDKALNWSLTGYSYLKVLQTCNEDFIFAGAEQQWEFVDTDVIFSRCCAMCSSDPLVNDTVIDMCELQADLTCACVTQVERLVSQEGVRSAFIRQSGAFPAPAGKFQYFCIDLSSLPTYGSDRETCLQGNSLNDGYEYLYNYNREEASIPVCRTKDCTCCRRERDVEPTTSSLVGFFLSGDATPNNVLPFTYLTQDEQPFVSSATVNVNGEGEVPIATASISEGAILTLNGGNFDGVNTSSVEVYPLDLFYINRIICY